MHRSLLRTLTSAGASWLMAAALASTTSADTLTLISANEETGGFFGTAVDGIPDLNGDGVDDVIVGAPEENGGGVSDSGRVYIYSGATGLLIRAQSSPNDTVEGDYGIAVAGVPDLNGDGRGDYVVGAPGELSNGGRIYVYSGVNGTLLRTHTSPNNENFGRFGECVSGIEDLSGDGRGDYIVGAPEENDNRGRAYVYSGNTGNLLRTHNSPNSEIGGEFGHSVAGIPDVNNDNRGDYIVGAPYEDPGGALTDSGRAYVYNGMNGALLHSLASPTPDSGGRFGWSVGGGPDAGGNGFGDVIVGAPYEEVSVGGTDYEDGGRAHLFSGTSGNLAHSYRAPDDELNSENLFGWAVDGMTDRNGDGLGELLIGAPGWPGYHVYVVKGTGDYGILVNFDSPDDLGANQFFGGAVAGVGDANGDGRGDFIAGGRGSDNFPDGPSESGRAYINRTTLGNNSCTLLTVDVLSDGANPITNIGASGTAGTGFCLDDMAADVWYRYTATCTGNVIFSTCGTANFDTIVAVYPGCAYGAQPLFACSLASNSPLACNDDTFGCDFGSIVSVPAAAGQCFFVRVGGYQGDQGIGVLEITCSCFADLTGDGVVNGADLGELLSQWDTNGSADLNNDNTVDGADLGFLLASWGEC